ncbi:hypothetical protein [Kutzneria sp. 744]|uniref:hypothetical protein n=1 Tax=Kutzneria sp. (strain 744) TaxID=345341 RepID=UPI0004BAD855|nr:hypothetical protein [Kutzneria sp. 744]
MSADVSAEVVACALRRVRPTAYRIERSNGVTTITLVVNVSAAGRRNAAARIVAALADSGLELTDDDPIQALAGDRSPLVVRRHR